MFYGVYSRVMWLVFSMRPNTVWKKHWGCWSWLCSNLLIQYGVSQTEVKDGLLNFSACEAFIGQVHWFHRPWLPSLWTWDINIMRRYWMERGTFLTKFQIFTALYPSTSHSTEWFLRSQIFFMNTIIPGSLSFLRWETVLFTTCENMVYYIACLSICWIPNSMKGESVEVLRLWAEKQAEGWPDTGHKEEGKVWGDKRSVWGNR